MATFRTTARAVLHEYYKQQQQEKNTTEEKMKLIQAAARLIKEDIKSITITYDIYPSCDDLRSQEAGTEFMQQFVEASFLLLLFLFFYLRDNLCKELSIGLLSLA